MRLVLPHLTGYEAKAWRVGASHPRCAQKLSYTCLEPSVKDVGSGVSQWGPSFPLSVCSPILWVAVGWLDASASGLHVMTSWKLEKSTFLGGSYVFLHPRPHTQRPRREVSVGEGGFGSQETGL